jgi:hypothetical protein
MDRRSLITKEMNQSMHGKQMGSSNSITQTLVSSRTWLRVHIRGTGDDQSAALLYWCWYHRQVSAGRQKSGQWGYTSSIQVVPLNCYVSVSKAGKYNMMCVALICNWVVIICYLCLCDLLVWQILWWCIFLLFFEIWEQCRQKIAYIYRNL